MSDDPIRDYQVWESAQERKSRHYPRCDKCDGYITDEILYRINGQKLCLDCVKDLYGEDADEE